MFDGQNKADWDFYINSTDENRNKSEAATEEVYELYRDQMSGRRLPVKHEEKSALLFWRDRY